VYQSTQENARERERERGGGEFPRNLYYYLGMVLRSVVMSGNLIGLMKWLVLKIEQSCQELCVIRGGHRKPIALKIKVSVETHWKLPHDDFCGKISGLFFPLFLFANSNHNLQCYEKTMLLTWKLLTCAF